jgi:hypothetical protein
MTLKRLLILADEMIKNNDEEGLKSLSAQTETYIKKYVIYV